MRGRAMLRYSSTLILKNDTGDYSAVEVTREQADLDDILSWAGSKAEICCTNETRGTSFVAHFHDCNMSLAAMRQWLDSRPR